MSTKVQKWGNSLGVRLPKEIALGARMTEGTSVEFRVEGSTILLRPTKKHQYRLEELLKNIGPDNFHEEEFWGKPRGKEVW